MAGFVLSPMEAAFSRVVGYDSATFQTVDRFRGHRRKKSTRANFSPIEEKTGHQIVTN